MTTRRFTAKASTFTERLSVVQAEQAKLRAKMAALDAEERSLKAFLVDFYDEGKTEVSLSNNKTLTVSVSTTERNIMDQDRVRSLLARLGKKVPSNTIEIVSFRVSQK